MADSQFTLLDKWLNEKPQGTELSRRAWAEVKYITKDGAETDITEDISKYLISLEFTDNLSDTADDLTLTLEDRAQLWSADWYPQGEGNILDITIHCFNRITLADGETTLHAGKFEIDEISITGFPSTVQIKGVSIIGGSTLRAVRKNKTWEKITVQACAADIAGQNGLGLFWDSGINPTLQHVEQADESDLQFLKGICHDHGLSLKVTPDQIIIFDEEKYEAQKPNIVVFRPGVKADISGIPLPLRWVLDYSFSAKTRDTYRKCVVKYQKGKKKEVISGEFAAPDQGEGGRTLYVREQVENEAEAEKLAKKRLREANRDTVAGSFSTIGNPNFAAGVTLEMRNFGKFDGKYLITKVSHKISSNYTITVDIRRCLDGY